MVSGKQEPIFGLFWFSRHLRDCLAKLGSRRTNCESQSEWFHRNPASESKSLKARIDIESSDDFTIERATTDGAYYVE